MNLTTTTTTMQQHPTIGSMPAPQDCQPSLAASDVAVPGPSGQLQVASVPASGAGSANRPFRCSHPGCGASFPKAAKLDRHLRSHSDERPFVCQHEGCDASYKRSEHLKVHQRRHQDESQRSFHCTEPGCGMAFWTSTHLKNHIGSVHKDELLRIGTRTIRLPVPDSKKTAEGSPDAADLPESCSVDLTEYRCTEPGCSEVFHKRKVLRLHIREAHSDVAVSEALRSQQPSIANAAAGDGPLATGREPVGHEELARKVLLPFACSFQGCTMRFATNAKRRSHFKTHEQGRYTCSVAHSTPQHPASDHGQPDPSALASANGSHVYVFPTWTALQEHMKQCHPPTCPWPGCGKLFTRQDNLRAHYKRHEKRKLDLERELGSQGSLGSRSPQGPRGTHDSDSQSDSDFEERRPLPGEVKSSPRRPIAAVEEGCDLDALASDLSQKRSRRSSHLSAPETLSSPCSSSTSTALPLGSELPETEQTLADGQGLFTCTWNGCGRKYTRKSGLSIHIRSRHLGERPFECPGCKKKFAHKHLVTRHRRSCHSSGPLATLRAAQLNRVESCLERPELAAGEAMQTETDSTSPPGKMRTDTMEEAIECIDDDNDNDNDDEYFRREGGAVPEEDSERGRTSESQQIIRKPGSAIKATLLDLLTGRGYGVRGLPRSETVTSSEGNPSEGSTLQSAPPAKRRRTTRDRIYECPWQSIVEVVKISAADASGNGSEALQQLQADICDIVPADGADSGEPTHAPSCSYRFSRIYDLRRHLKSSHGLELEDREIRAWLHGMQTPQALSKTPVDHPSP
ncbi:hypothetical protein ACQY0O_000228 [Thecaphora frezii]